MAETTLRDDLRPRFLSLAERLHGGGSLQAIVESSYQGAGCDGFILDYSGGNWVAQFAAGMKTVEGVGVSPRDAIDDAVKQLGRFGG